MLKMHGSIAGMAYILKRVKERPTDGRLKIEQAHLIQSSYKVTYKRFLLPECSSSLWGFCFLKRIAIKLCKNIYLPAFRYICPEICILKMGCAVRPVVETEQDTRI